jgi:outer membrane protein TolC
MFRVLLAALLVPVLEAPALTLDALVAEVDAANPSARAAQHRVEAATAAITRARTPEEPVATFTVREVPTDPRMWMMPRTAIAQPMVMGQLGWMVPITGMPAVRGRMAAAMRDMATADVRMTRIALRRAAAVAWWQLWLNQEAQRINREAADTLEAIEQVALAQYASGRAMHHGVLRIQAERESIKTDALALQQAQGALVALINALRATPGRAIGTLEARLHQRVVWNEDKLLAAALRNRPELAMARARRAGATAEESMALRSLVPDPMVMFMLEARPGFIPPMPGGPPLPETPMVGAGVAIPLPVFAPWRQLRDADAARSRQRAAMADADAAEQTVTAELRAVLVRITTLEQREELIVNALEPRAREALEAAQAAMAAGQASALEVLESRRQLQGIALELFNTRAEREAALADLDATVAGPALQAQEGAP